MASIIKNYRRLLHERPFITNVFTTSTFMATGDLTSQCLLQGKTLDDIDLKQTARFATAGLIFVGPAVRGCLVMIDKIFGPTKSIAILGKKLLLDQGVIAPCFLGCNITVLTLLKTNSFAEVKKEVEKSYVPILKMNYMFWPFVQMINFYFIPLTYRVVFGSSAALIWNTSFSYKFFKDAKEEAVTKVAATVAQ